MLALLIAKFYGEIEIRFVDNFNKRDFNPFAFKELLTPWDAHIAIFVISERSSLLGKTLMELKDKVWIEGNERTL